MWALSWHQCEEDGQVFFSLDDGVTKFTDLIQLVEFYQLNRGVLPCKLKHPCTVVALWPPSPPPPLTRLCLKRINGRSAPFPRSWWIDERFCSHFFKITRVFWRLLTDWRCEETDASSVPEKRNDLNAASRVWTPLQFLPRSPFTDKHDGTSRVFTSQPSFFLKRTISCHVDHSVTNWVSFRPLLTD